jgi:hypothetical protein
MLVINPLWFVLASCIVYGSGGFYEWGLECMSFALFPFPCCI